MINKPRGFELGWNRLGMIFRRHVIPERVNSMNGHVIRPLNPPRKFSNPLIINSGYRPPRTHKLSVLIGIGNSLNKRFRNTKFKYRDLEIYTFVSRYPFLRPGEHAAPHDFVTVKDADKCIDEAENIMNEVSKCMFPTRYPGIRRRGRHR